MKNLTLSSITFTLNIETITIEKILLIVSCLFIFICIIFFLITHKLTIYGDPKNSSFYIRGWICMILGLTGLVTTLILSLLIK
jgi:hypothetical protein